MAKEHCSVSLPLLAYSFGANERRELGLNDNQLHLYPTLLDFCIEKNVIDVACGDQLTALLTADGNIYTCGLNNNGQCGLVSTNDVLTLTLISSLAEKGIRIKRIFSGHGSQHLAAVATTGELYTVGFNSNGQLGLGTTTTMSGPSVVDELRGVAEVAEVACSYLHTIIRATNGMVYACGRNDHGQLGIPDGLDCHIPKPIPFFNTKRVLAVSCGEFHTIVSLESGGLMAFGKNEDGQLGIGIKSDPVLIPTLVVFEPIQGNKTNQSQSNSNLQPEDNGQQQDEILEEQEQKISGNKGLNIFPKIACGYNHTVAVSDEGTVYAFGLNNNGQLGLGHTKHVLYAEIVNGLTLERIVDVACGSNHTLVVSDEGKVFSFGMNSSGQLGLGTQTDCYSPQIIASLRTRHAYKVVAGNYHSFSLVENTTSQSTSSSLRGAQNMVQDLRHMVNNPTRSDVTFVVEKEKIFAHSLLLAARCEPMEKMLDGRMCDGSLPEINIPEYSYAVFLAFMEYLYTGNVELLTQISSGNGNECVSVNESKKLFMNEGDKMEFLLELLRLADQYLVLRLRKMCENSVVRLFSVENVSPILQNAHFRDAFEFKKRCLNYILKHLTAVIATDAFIALPPELLQEVLQAASRLGAAIPNNVLT